ncbi:uncharacterized protein DSM5745_06842 [Aspergillus mulundensis]|uniref:Uncharacterized protein n=1 Tax=Aspergillus mulundensis TaxID=1810919 RepID=A0A3D8RSA9_9EURO|nr:hypothetical protein DSM5745_06842 [Aspergillus mulundensis]RDW76850.1 hypothetical protein DSM5745_06842 [Aspergillus mulundensis]
MAIVLIKSYTETEGNFFPPPGTHYENAPGAPVPDDAAPVFKALNAGFVELQDPLIAGTVVRTPGPPGAPGDYTIETVAHHPVDRQDAQFRLNDAWRNRRQPDGRRNPDAEIAVLNKEY